MACSQTLVGIPRDCESSVGGIVEAWFTNWQEGIFTVSADTEDRPVAVSGISAVTFYHYAFRKGTGSMTSTLNADEPNGVNYVSTDVVLQFGKMETAKRTGVAALALGGLAGIVKDANGKYWALGVSEPVTASAGTAQTGTARTDGNWYQITLTDDYISFPLEIPAELAEAITVAD